MHKPQRFSGEVRTSVKAALLKLGQLIDEGGVFFRDQPVLVTRAEICKKLEMSTSSYTKYFVTDQDKEGLPIRLPTRDDVRGLLDTLCIPDELDWELRCGLGQDAFEPMAQEAHTFLAQLDALKAVDEQKLCNALELGLGLVTPDEFRTYMESFLAHLSKLGSETIYFVGDIPSWMIEVFKECRQNMGRHAYHRVRHVCSESQAPTLAQLGLYLYPSGSYELRVHTSASAESMSPPMIVSVSGGAFLILNGLELERGHERALFVPPLRSDDRAATNIVEELASRPVSLHKTSKLIVRITEETSSSDFFRKLEHAEAIDGEESLVSKLLSSRVPYLDENEEAGALLWRISDERCKAVKKEVKSRHYYQQRRNFLKFLVEKQRVRHISFVKSLDSFFLEGKLAQNDVFFGIGWTGEPVPPDLCLAILDALEQDWLCYSNFGLRLIDDEVCPYESVWMTKSKEKVFLISVGREVGRAHLVIELHDKHLTQPFDALFEVLWMNGRIPDEGVRSRWREGIQRRLQSCR